MATIIRNPLYMCIDIDAWYCEDCTFRSGLAIFFVGILLKDLLICVGGCDIVITGSTYVYKPKVECSRFIILTTLKLKIQSFKKLLEKF